MVEKNILVSIDDARLKDISEVLSNKSCLKILDLLAEKDLSVSDISVKLNIPLNTSDYNVKKLVKAGLIEKKSHFWSVKGKKIPVYTVSEKKIVISPKSRFLINAGIFTFIFAGVSSLIVRSLTQIKVYEAEENFLMASSSASVAEISASASWISSIPSWQWFLAGAWLGLVVFFAYGLISNKLKEVKNNGKIS